MYICVCVPLNVYYTFLMSGEGDNEDVLFLIFHLSSTREEVQGHHTSSALIQQHTDTLKSSQLKNSITCIYHDMITIVCVCVWVWESGEDTCTCLSFCGLFGVCLYVFVYLCLYVTAVCHTAQSSCSGTEGVVTSESPYVC